jgi:hypothetical protein
LKRLGTYAILAVGLVALAVGLWKAREERFDPLSHLPTADAMVASIDVGAIRKAGLLTVFTPKPQTEEAEYLNFVQSTGFNYEKDLDNVAAAFTHDAIYFIVRGRFDWVKLEAFAKANGGGCYERLCHLPGSVPERRISFLPLQSNVMAMAVSTDDLGAARLREVHRSGELQQLRDPVWMSIPASALKHTAETVPAVRLFAATVAGADRVTIAIGPKQGGDYAARLEAICASSKEAQTVTEQLKKVTGTLKSTDPLAGFLLSGTFQQSNQKVFGYWPIPKGLFENLAGGM